MNLGRWPVRRILAVWASWILLLVLIPIGILEISARQLRRAYPSASQGSGGWAAIRFNVDPLAAIVWLLPPILLTAAWLAMRRHRRAGDS